MKFSQELIQKAKQAKTEAELIAFAKENGIELTEQDAKQYFAQLHREGALADDELDNIAGGCGGNYTYMYCKKCSWTTTWSGCYDFDRPYAGPCPVCGDRYLYAGEYVK